MSKQGSSSHQVLLYLQAGEQRDGHRAQSHGPWAPDAEPEAGRVRKAEEAEPRGPGHIQPGPKGRDRRDSGPGARVPKKVAAKKTPGDRSIGTITPGVTPTPGQRPGGQRDRRHPNENGPYEGGPLTRGDASAGREPRADIRKKELIYFPSRTVPTRQTSQNATE